MSVVSKQLSLARVIGLSTVLVLPLLVLELKNQPVNQFPIVLFAVLWLLPFAFILLALELLAGKRLTVTLALGVVMLAIAMFWVMLVIDQMPCFLGVPNCD
jgi:hypothetical protein